MANQKAVFSLKNREGLMQWVSDCLGCKASEIERGESLIELGMDSLSIMRLPTLLAKENCTVRLAELMQNPTLQSWEQLICQTQELSVDSTFEELPTVDFSQPFVLTDMQKAYWLGRKHIFKLGGIAAHGYIEISCERLDISNLEKALNRTIRLHPMLRMYIEEDGLQHIVESVSPYRINVRHGNDGWLQTREEMKEAVLPTDRWPLFDIRVTRLNDNQDLLHIGFDVTAIDLASLGQWFTEWFTLYKNSEIKLPIPKNSFAQYVNLQQKMRNSQATEMVRQWWHKRIQSLPPAPDLPLAATPEEVTPPSFDRISKTLSFEHWSQLKTLATRAGITPSTLILASLAAVLAQWSRNPHFTLSLTLFDRLNSYHDFSGVLGDFTSLLLVEADFRSITSFKCHAETLQKEIWSGLDHALVSGVEVMASIAKRYGQIGENKVPIVFTSAIGIDSYLDAASILGTIAYARNQTPQIWLDVQAVEHQGGIMLIWDSVKGLFPDNMLQAMFDAQVSLLEHLQNRADWDNPVPTLLPSEQYQRIVRINETSCPFEPQLLFSPFLTQVQKRPDAFALVSNDRSLTYRELDNASARLAHHLQQIQQKNILTDTLIAIAIPRSWQQIVAVLAILRAGSAYLPLDPDHPSTRISALIKQADISLVVTIESLQTVIPEGIECVTVDESYLDNSQPVAIVTPANPEHLAYVIFTSGSTGKPKGVMIEHQTAMNTILDINHRHKVSNSDSIIGVSSLSFDLSVYDIFGPLSAGAALVLPPATTMPEPDAWLELIIRHKVTLWNSVPALLRLLLDRITDKEQLNSIRLFMSSGDQLSVDVARRIRALPETPSLVSMGGATEASIWSISKTVDTVQDSWRSVPYGQPLANQRFYVLDEQYRLRPDWVPGELFIAGLGLARGYWKNKELTDKVFFHHPQTGEMLYRTGDIGCFLPNGDIEFLGRVDDQVKVNGLRLELGEIETALTSQENIIAAVATVIHSEKRGDQLAAFIQHKTTMTPDTIEIQNELRKILPTPLIPTIIQTVSDFPLTPNGKIDRKTLVNMIQQKHVNQEQTTSFVISNETEKHIAIIWAELLGHEPLSIEQSFFDAGGTSLLTISLAHKLSQAFNTSIPIVMLFQYPTIATQAALLNKKEHASSETSLLRGKKRRNMQGMLAQTRSRKTKNKGK